METGMQFTELRRSQARALVDELVAQGHLARDQVSAAVDEMVDAVGSLPPITSGK